MLGVARAVVAAISQPAAPTPAPAIFAGPTAWPSAKGGDTLGGAADGVTEAFQTTAPQT